MQYQIIHATTYKYDQPVQLAPHLFRLRPRCDVSQTLNSFELTIVPEPIQITENIELDGNNQIKAWFDHVKVKTLTITAQSQITTHRHNPFNFLLEDWATQLPIDYPSSMAKQLSPYLDGSIDPIAYQLAQEIWLNTQGNTIEFLTTLNLTINRACKYIIRETGDPFPPSITWQQKIGSCRDLTVLFMAACRAVGLAARFVSGYEPGDPDLADKHPHAWAEVYLPGAGWRGYDPNHGIVVQDQHIAIVASIYSQQTIPIRGTLIQALGVSSQMEYQLSILKIPSSKAIL
jgi:transglutaminase-like putative cysteine protease